MYFEFDDARRLHQPYTDHQYRSKLPRPGLALTRLSAHLEAARVQLAAAELEERVLRRRDGDAAGKIGALDLRQLEPTNHFINNVRILNSFYHWPRTRSEYNIFFKEVFRMPEFWPELAKKLTFGAITAIGDTGAKLAMWQYVYGGTNSPAEFCDFNSFKNVVLANFAAIPTCWTGVPFENARRAYYADRSWPLELRKGYTSPLNALLRVPFEEGPMRLMQGGFPLMMNAYLFWATMYCCYSWFKNKTFYMWVY